MHDQSDQSFANVSSNLDERNPTTLPDLPQVEPPSAGFVIQLFVIPAVVVVVVIIVWLLFGKLAGGERDAMEYVRQLRSPTANWRLAFELASLIQHDPKIGSDPVLLGELADLLSHELDKNDDDLRLTQYVALTLGAFRTLEAKTQSGQAIDPLVPLARALSPKFPTPIRLAAAASLAKQAARLEGPLDAPGQSRPWGSRQQSGNQRSGRWPSMPSVFLGDRRRRKCFASGLQETKTALSVTTPPLPWPAAEIPLARQLCAKCFRPPTLTR